MSVAKTLRKRESLAPDVSPDSLVNDTDEPRIVWQILLLWRNITAAPLVIRSGAFHSRHSVAVVRKAAAIP